jgi:hypothetical protein
MEKSLPHCQFFHTLLLIQDRCGTLPVSRQGDCQPNLGLYPQEAENVPPKPVYATATLTEFTSLAHQNHLGGTKYQVAIKIEILSSHCGGAAMVALDATNSDNAVRALRYGICQQKLQLPDLVPTQLHAG